MVYDLYKNGTYVNGVVGSLEFIEKYCAEMGYTYKDVTHKYSDKSEDLNLFNQNDSLESKQIKAVSDRLDFIEDCMAEMAVQVYSE